MRMSIPEDLSSFQVPLTHSVAVTGYVYQQGKFLLMKRARPPLIWAPPGGRLLPHEDPCSGVLREVREETGIEVQLLGLVDCWFGEIPSRGRLLSLDYLTLPRSDRILLSDEHTDYVWASIADIENGNPPLGNDASSFRVSDFQKAANEWTRYKYQLPPPS